jgi:diketogulonate reductase-like aldo/keto reductase
MLLCTEDVPIHETWKAMEELVDEGNIPYQGHQ